MKDISEGLSKFGKEEFMMAWGRGRGRGRGFGYGPNMSWNCRLYPWLPRWWWANPSGVQEQLPGQPIPLQFQAAAQIGGPGGSPSAMYGPFGSYVPTMPTMTKEQESQMLEQQMDFLRQQLEQLQKRLKESAEGE